jgi:hypothetical protein
VKAKEILESCKHQCEQAKSQMTAQMNQITDPVVRTAYQMAINSVDNCIAQCHTAAGVLK